MSAPDGAGPWVSHVQGVEKVSDHGTKNFRQKEKFRGKFVGISSKMQL
jgi:hypothetical protein